MSNEIVKINNSTNGLEYLLTEIQNNPLKSLAPLLPLYLTLKGKPYNLDCKTFPGSPGREYVMMEPMFRVNPIPARMIWKCGRQVSKTTTISAQAIMQAANNPYLNILLIAPLAEQIKKISTDNIKPFIFESTIKEILIDSTCTQNVLKREFLNKSRMYFSYAFLSAERVRGISADMLYIDEIQSIDLDFLPIIDQCISASRFGRIRRYTGTPLSLDNTIEVEWEKSSQAEWVFPCESCNKWNCPNLACGIEKMIGKETIVCAHCQKPINPVHKKAHWRHEYPDRQFEYAGYHLPQIILPLHFAQPNNWKDILFRREHEPRNIFLNECLGESSDIGERMITLNDIKEASVLNQNTAKAAIAARNQFSTVIMSVDWGGYGRMRGLAENKTKLGASYTTYAITGCDPHGKIHCIYCGRFEKLNDYSEETAALINIFKTFHCDYFTHDFGGSGDTREVLMVQAGIPKKRIIPIVYVRATSKPMLTYLPPSDHSPRSYYSLDKSRSLRIMAQGIKTKFILLPEWTTSKEITNDLLALIEEKAERAISSDVSLVTRKPTLSDDFAHALNFGAIAHWHRRRAFPNFANAFNINYNPQISKFED